MSGSPTADVRLNIAANSAASQFAMLEAQAKRFMRNMDAHANSLGDTSEKTSGSIGDWVTRIAKATAAIAVMGVGLRSVLGVAQLINEEFKKKIELSKMANEVQVPYEQKLKSFFFQSIPADVSDRGGFLEKVDAKIQDSKVRDKSAALSIVQYAMSTMGTEMAPMDRVDFGLAVAEGRRDLLGSGGSVEDLQRMQSAAGMAHMMFKKDLPQGFTTEDAAQAQLALHNSTIVASAVADMGTYAKNLAPFANKVATDFGVTQVEGLALGAALSNRYNDMTAQLVQTGGINILATMKEVESRFGIDTAGKTLLQRKDFLRGDSPKAREAQDYVLREWNRAKAQMTDEERAELSRSELNRRYMPALGGRKKTLFQSLDFFQPKGFADDAGSLNSLLVSGLENIGAVFKPGSGGLVVDTQKTYASMRDKFRAQTEYANTAEAFKAANLEMGTAEAAEGLKQNRANVIKQDLGDMDSEFQKMLLASGMSWSERYSQSWAQYLSGGESYEETLERQRRVVSLARTQLLNRKKREAGYRGEATPSQSYNALSPAERREFYTPGSLNELGFSEQTVTDVGILSSKLDEIVAELRRQTEADKQPKKVKIEEQQKQPEKPAAAQIGN